MKKNLIFFLYSIILINILLYSVPFLNVNTIETNNIVPIDLKNVNTGWNNDDPNWNIALDNKFPAIPVWKHNNVLSYVNLSQQNAHQTLYNANKENSYTGVQFNSYFGRSNDNPYDISATAKYSEANSFTFGFMAQGNNDACYNKSWAADYLDQLQEVNSYNKNVWIAYGGAVENPQLYLTAPNVQYIYNVLLNLCVGYNVYNLDFDFEKSSLPTSSEKIERLAKALGEIQYVLKHYYNKQLQVRITLGSIADSMYSPFTKYLDLNYLYWNDMVKTELRDGKPDTVPLKQYIVQDTNSLYSGFYHALGYDDDFIHEHLEFTYDYVAINDIKNDVNNWSDVTQTAIDNKLHAISTWSGNKDHPKNSLVDREPNDYNSNSKKDYYFQNMAAENLDMNTNNPSNYKGSSKPTSVKNIKLYSHTKIGDTFTWTPSKNADYYQIEDSSGNILTKTKNTKAGVLSSNFNNDKNNIYIVAVNKNGTSDKTHYDYNDLVTTNKTVLDDQLWYYDANVQYNYISQDNIGSLVKYVYYKGNVYENISKSSIKPNEATPDKNTDDWKLITNPYLTDEQKNDLSKYEWDQFVSSDSSIISKTATWNENTSKYISNFNVVGPNNSNPPHNNGGHNSSSNHLIALCVTVPIIAISAISLTIYMIVRKKIIKK